MLTQRELEILRLFAQGLDAQEVARKLHLAVKTVRSHIESCRGKAGSTNVRGAIWVFRDQVFQSRSLGPSYAGKPIAVLQPMVIRS